jgi:hypothetical protein
VLRHIEFFRSLADRSESFWRFIQL